jgi:RNA polymerase sigma factor (sigma-70 family)
MDICDPGGEVFIVDDDKASIARIRGVLQPAGYLTEAYESAEDFLASYDAARVSCLILEAKLPGISGLELQQRLRTQGEHLQIVFVTRDKDVQSAVTALKNGATDYLEKPVNHGELLRAVREAIEADRHRRRDDRERAVLKSRLGRLTPRENEVTTLLFDGKTIKQIASKLGITFQTVSKHRSRVLDKLEAASDVDLVRIWLKRASLGA